MAKLSDGQDASDETILMTDVGRSLHKTLQVTRPDGLQNEQANKVWVEFHPAMRNGSWPFDLKGLCDFTIRSVKIACCPTVTIDIKA